MRSSAAALGGGERKKEYWAYDIMTEYNHLLYAYIMAISVKLVVQMGNNASILPISERITQLLAGFCTGR